MVDKNKLEAAKYALQGILDDPNTDAEQVDTLLDLVEQGSKGVQDAYGEIMDQL